MLPTILVLATFSALCVSSVDSFGVRPSDTLRVHVNMEFDASIKATVIASAVKGEAAAIWSSYGVELLWSDSAVDAALHLDVIVARHPADVVTDRAHAVLGLTTLDRFGTVHEPIRVFFNPIESLLQQRHGAIPLLHDRELARALARVLAHELGHVLLGAPAYHDHSGLMRATFPSEELAEIDRRSFRLTDESADRLRARIAGVPDAQRPADCTHPVLRSPTVR